MVGGCELVFPCSEFSVERVDISHKYTSTGTDSVERGIWECGSPEVTKRGMRSIGTGKFRFYFTERKR